MSKQSETGFISEIDLTNYPPFKDGGIELKGENEIQSLIKFYLENKKIVDSKGKNIDPVVNAQRFKINCIVGENGVGKSRLLKQIIEQKHGEHEVLLDDFFILSQSFLKDYISWEWWSFSNINKQIFWENLPSGQAYGFNGLLSWLFVFDYLNDGIFFWVFNNNKKYDLLFMDTAKGDFFPFRVKFKGKIEKDSENDDKDSKNDDKDKNKNYPTISDTFWKWEDTKKMLDLLPKLYEQLNKDKEDKEDIEDIEDKDNKDNKISRILERMKDIISFICIKKIKGDWLLNHYEDLKRELKDKSPFNKQIDQKSIDMLWEKIRTIPKQNNCGVGGDWSWNEVLKAVLSYFRNLRLSSTKDAALSFSEQNLLIKLFFEKIFWNVDLQYDESIKFSALSSGEKIIALRLWNIYREILRLQSEKKKDFLILIDEPDLHLHLDWQRQYIQKLIDVFSTLPSDIKLHFIIATHSPFLISDLPTESIVALKKDDKWSTEVLKLKKNSTFWANFVDLIRSGFFFKDQMLMWSFAEEIIKKIAEDERRDILENDENWISIKKKEDLEERGKLKEFIGDDFLRDNLLYFKP